MGEYCILMGEGRDPERQEGHWQGRERTDESGELRALKGMGSLQWRSLKAVTSWELAKIPERPRQRW